MFWALLRAGRYQLPCTPLGSVELLTRYGIEYDVGFTGNLSSFTRAHDQTDARDLLAYLVGWRPFTGWWAWSKTMGPARQLVDAGYGAAIFMPVVRCIHSLARTSSRASRLSESLLSQVLEPHARAARRAVRRRRDGLIAIAQRTNLSPQSL